MKIKTALFLDRDGVINADRGYVFRREEFEFINGIFELVEKANKLGYSVIVITNQSGIARGLYTKKDFLDLTDWMKTEFEKHGGKIDAIYFCPHHPQAKIEQYKIDCECRKPRAGMFLQAAKDLQIDLQNSILVGDKARDCEAGKTAGIKKIFLFDSNEDFEDAKKISDFYEIFAD